MRCLLVDDSARFRRAARTLLEHDGVEVEVAATGSEAARRAPEVRPDVVLLDIDLGGESGFELAHRFHAAWHAEGSPLRRVGIILVSTHAEQDFEDLIGTSPALGFLSKSSLSAGAIRQLLDGRGAP